MTTPATKTEAYLTGILAGQCPVSIVTVDPEQALIVLGPGGPFFEGQLFELTIRRIETPVDPEPSHPSPTKGGPRKATARRRR